MPSMSLLVLIVCIALCVLVLFSTWTRWQLGHGARVLLRGLGLILVVVGLYLTHLADLAGHGIRSIYDWAHRTRMGTRLSVGFAVAAVGLLFYLIGTFMRRRTRDEAREVRRNRKGIPADSNRQVAPAGAARPVAGRTRTNARNLDDEDAEVADILNRRGIN